MAGLSGPTSSAGLNGHSSIQSDKDCHPLAAAQGAQVVREGGRIGEGGEVAAEPQTALAVGLRELVEEERSKAEGEDADGQEETRAAGDPGQVHQ